MVIRLFDHVEVTADSTEATEKLPGCYLDLNGVQLTRSDEER